MWLIGKVLNALCKILVLQANLILLVDASSSDTFKSVGTSGVKAVNGVLGYFSSFASSIFKRPSGTDSEGLNMGKVLKFEAALARKMELSEHCLTSEDTEHHVPVIFPEASAFSSHFIRDVGGHLENWMDVLERKKLKDGYEVISQHILWIRSSGSKASTSYFIYRPSFVAELDPSTILPHFKYQEEAEKSSAAVIDVIKEHPNDQIIFAGLQSGGIIATIHAWMVAASVPIVYKNLKRFKGELHQVKLFLFDSDCALSSTYSEKFPIPDWDVLRFYSGFGGSGVSADRCRYDSMKAIGFAYSYTPGLKDILFPESASVSSVDFYTYYEAKTRNFSGEFDSDEEDGGDLDENVDGGMLIEDDDEEANRDDASVAQSDISMSVDGGAGYQQHQLQQRRSHSKELKIQSITPSNPRNEEEFKRNGVKLLSYSIGLAKFFCNNLKDIFRQHYVSYLQRNVNLCAKKLENNLIDSLLGKQRETPVVEKGIRIISCKVKAYNEKSKEALVVCDMESSDVISVTSRVFAFRTVARNDMDATLKGNNLALIENDWEEMSMSGQSTATGASTSSSSMRRRQAQRSRGGSISREEDIFFDEQSLTGTVADAFRDNEQAWSNCLASLFGIVPELAIINPVGSNIHSLPGGSPQVTNCEFELLSKPKHFAQLYHIGPSMFFSIFSEVVATSSIPQFCKAVLEAPRIGYNDLGNANVISKTLNEFFTSDGASRIDHTNTLLNGLEIEQNVSNIQPNGFKVFTRSLCDKLKVCLAASTLMSRMYDCNSHVTLWAGREHCPEACKTAVISGKEGKIHLCSRILDCGEGIYLGFRGGKSFGSDRPLSEEFAHVPEVLARMPLGPISKSSYFAAFQLKHVEGLTAAFKRNFRFAVFLTEHAKETFIDANVSRRDSSSGSVTSTTLARKKVEKFLTPVGVGGGVALTAEALNSRRMNNFSNVPEDEEDEGVHFGSVQSDLDGDEDLELIHVTREEEAHVPFVTEQQQQETYESFVGDIAAAAAEEEDEFLSAAPLMNDTAKVENVIFSDSFTDALAPTFQAGGVVGGGGGVTEKKKKKKKSGK